MLFPFFLFPVVSLGAAHGSNSLDHRLLGLDPFGIGLRDFCRGL
jgi:hypothetical protein